MGRRAPSRQSRAARTFCRSAIRRHEMFHPMFDPCHRDLAMPTCLYFRPQRYVVPCAREGFHPDTARLISLLVFVLLFPSCAFFLAKIGMRIVVSIILLGTIHAVAASCFSGCCTTPCSVKKRACCKPVCASMKRCQGTPLSQKHSQP